jgi:multimeric flavodoxin WrbA/putative sterol carrier protein
MVTLVPHFWPHLGWPWLFNFVLPTALFLGVGFPANRWYPQYRQRRLGLLPASAAAVPEAASPGPASLKENTQTINKAPSSVSRATEPTANLSIIGKLFSENRKPKTENDVTAVDKEEEDKMSGKYRVAAVNGSPHEGFGNTSQMLAMLKEHLAQEDFDLEEIFLSKQHIEYCAGCGMCIEKGACWIRDDHKGVVKKLLEADAVILASPVYFRQVTAQMKTFLDRSLGYGHRPRGTWKPGLAVSVSAGWGETEVAQYLAMCLRVYGAFAIGQLTAIGVGPGGFWGKEALEARAGDLARDLARAVKEKRRFPPCDLDLDYWHFIGGLVREHRDFMKADYQHWQKLGILDSFEAYIGQSRSPGSRDPGIREAWIKGLMERQKGRAGQAAQAAEAPQAAAANPGKPETVRAMMEAMPGALNRDAAAGLAVIYQFEVSGDENFTAHLLIDNGAAAFLDGPASKPDVIIKTPADVWLAVSKGEMDGAAAFMTGKFQVEGDIGLLMQLKGLFGG